MPSRGSYFLASLALALLLAAGLALALLACADDEARGPRTGAIVAHAIWPADAGPKALVEEGGGRYSHLPAEVVTVRGIISAPDIADVSKDFAASLGQGTISNVPAGSDRTLTLQGLDTAGTVLYEGVTTGITVVGGQTTDAGPVQMDAKVAPSAPTGVSATAGNAQVTISWSAVSGATSYNLYFGTTTGVTKTTGTKITAVSSPYAHTGRTNGTTYFYVVTAVNSAGESAESAQVSATPQAPAPGAPTGVTATAGNAQVTISWSAVSGAISYNLYWSTTTGVTKTNGTKITGVTSPHTHTGLTNGTTYYYVVTAVNAGGESAESAQVGATPLPPAPGAPALSLLTSGLKQLNFSWGAPAGATYYQLQQDPDGTGAFAQVGADIAAPTVTAAVSIAVHRLNWAQARYRVRACNAGGCGDSAPVGIASAMLAAIGYAKASNTGANDQLGYFAVALSGDGNTLAVGAYFEDSAATGVTTGSPNNTATGDAAADSGAVYVFTRSGAAWSQQAYVKASNTGAADQFGRAVALSGDGNTLAVGADFEDSAATGIGGNQADNTATNSGAAYVFTRSGAAWSQQAYVKASNTGTNDDFGVAVALSGDGNTLAVAAHVEDSAATGIGGDQNSNAAADSGAVYLFTRGGTAWSQQAYVKASNTGAGDTFGHAVTLSGDGNTLAVGANTEDSAATGVTTGSPNNTTTGDAAGDSGAAYVFTRSGATWSQQAYVKASNTGAGDLFGYAVALSGDGNMLAVGAVNEDSAATGIGGNQADNSASNSAAAYVFTRGGTTWTQQAYVKASNTGAADEFGFAVALSGDGNMLAVGARLEDSAATGIGGNQADNSSVDSGAVYLY
jgi:hypothetical protein